jgi:CheY-like chemotaxis protein
MDKLEINDLPKANADGKVDHDFSEHTLLVAEDIEINREIVAAILEDSGVSIDFAENGSEAVAIFNKNPEKFSLILMDIHMPMMDGYEATRKIRAIDCAEAKSIPIVAMTANVFKEDIESCLASGMNNHLGKPVDKKALLDMLTQYLVVDNT